MSPREGNRDAIRGKLIACRFLLPDLDIYVTLESDVVNSPEKLQQAMEQIKDVSDLFGRAKGRMTVAA